MYNQGIVVYEAHVNKGDFTFNGVFRDYAVLFINGTPAHSYDRS